MNSDNLMKKIVLVLVLLGSLTCSAQSIDRLLDKAFKRGADANGVYTLDNTKGAFITESDLVSYLRDKKGYVVLNSNSKTCSRFGYEEQVFDKILFLDGKDGYTKYNHCNARGTFYHPTPEPQRTIYSRLEFKEITSRMDDVPWSGKIVNGLLDGEGIGVLNFTNGWCAIKCKFQCGIPVSKPEIIYSFPSNSNYSSQFPFPNNYEDRYKMKSMLFQTYDATNDPTLRWAISENLKDYFEEEVRDKVEPEYKKALTLNSLKNMGYVDRYNAIEDLQTIRKKKEFWVIGMGDSYYTSIFRIDEVLETLNAIVDRYGGIISDSDWVSKAKEAIYVYNLAQYYKELILPRVSSLYSDWPCLHFFAHYNAYETHFDVKKAKKCIDDLNSVERKIKDTSSPFYDFYNAIYPDIQATKDWINNELEDYLINDWKRYREKKNREEEESHRNYMSEMCDKCKINGKQTTAPEGYVPEDDNWLFGHPAHSEKNGEIVFQNGNTCKWRYIYERGGTIIKVSGDYDGEYKSEKEMWDDILAKCKSRYCR